MRPEGEAAHYCPNEAGCPPQIKGKIEHFVTRRAMNINMGPETVEDLYEAGYIKDTADLYTLEIADLLRLERWADKSARNLMASLEESKQVPMKPGVVELLEYLKQHAVRMAVASSAPMELIKSNLRLAGIADYFDAVVSGEQVEHGKPFPDIFLLAAQKLNLQAQDCYVFEDGINGVRAGIQAGCSTIMVPDLVPPTKELYEQCTGIYPSLHAVLHALQTYTC